MVLLEFQDGGCIKLKYKAKPWFLKRDLSIDTAFDPPEISRDSFFKGTVARDFWSRFFSWIYSIFASDFEA
jgi:hypothetical protein